jgi:hypothetical protein
MKKENHLKTRIIADPPWGHWHEQITELPMYHPIIPRPVSRSLLETEIASWLYITKGTLERHPDTKLWRVFWSMPASMSVVYSPWCKSSLEAVLAAKETYLKEVKPYGTPEA